MHRKVEEEGGRLQWQMHGPTLKAAMYIGSPEKSTVVIAAITSEEVVP
jgi:hypothetical protein